MVPRSASPLVALPRRDTRRPACFRAHFPIHSANLICLGSGVAFVFQDSASSSSANCRHLSRCRIRLRGRGFELCVLLTEAGIPNPNCHRCTTNDGMRLVSRQAHFASPSATLQPHRACSTMGTLPMSGSGSVAILIRVGLGVQEKLPSTPSPVRAAISRHCG